MLLSIAAAREADGAAGLVHEQCVARKFGHVLVYEGEPVRGVPADEGAQRLDVLPLSPGCAGHGVARPAGCRARRRRVAAAHREERHARVRHRKPLVGLEGRREGFLRARPVREQPVHAVLEALGGKGRRGADRSPYRSVRAIGRQYSRKTRLASRPQAGISIEDAV